jgi:hypothetical protein
MPRQVKSVTITIKDWPDAEFQDWPDAEFQIVQAWRQIFVLSDYDCHFEYFEEEQKKREDDHAHEGQDAESGEVLT